MCQNHARIKGVGGGQERRKREETPRARIATSSIYLCSQLKHLGCPLQKRRKDKSECAVTKLDGTKYVADLPVGYSQEDFFFLITERREFQFVKYKPNPEMVSESTLDKKSSPGLDSEAN